jgi:hypothetical protein
MLACWSCYLKAVERAEKAEDKILSLEMAATEKEEQNKEMFAMLEGLEWCGISQISDEECISFCPTCDYGYDGHSDDCALGNLLAKVRLNGII